MHQNQTTLVACVGSNLYNMLVACKASVSRSATHMTNVAKCRSHEPALHPQALVNEMRWDLLSQPSYLGWECGYTHSGFSSYSVHRNSAEIQLPRVLVNKCGMKIWGVLWEVLCHLLACFCMFGRATTSPSLPLWWLHTLDRVYRCCVTKVVVTGKDDQRVPRSQVSVKREERLTKCITTVVIWLCSFFSADTCKAKWRTLRDSFVRQRKKVSASGSAGGPQKEWKFNDIMSFLVLHIQQRRSGKNQITVW